MANRASTIKIFMSPFSQPQARPSPTRRWTVVFATFATMAITASLGVWQLNRAAQKTALADAMQARASMPALAALPALGTAPAALSTQWHRRIQLRGHWLAEHTVYLDNRQMTDRGVARVGFEVVTPLLLSDGGAVLVQRGWVARDFIDRQRLTPVPTAGRDVEVVVDGRYAGAPPRLYEFKTDHAPRSRVRQNLDVDAFAQETGLRLRPGSVVQTGEDEASAVLRRNWVLPDTGVAKHHGYAFQWFALCGLTGLLFAWFQVIAPRRRSRLAPPSPSVSH